MSVRKITGRNEFLLRCWLNVFTTKMSRKWSDIDHPTSSEQLPDVSTPKSGTDLIRSGGMSDIERAQVRFKIYKEIPSKKYGNVYLGDRMSRYGSSEPK